VSFGDVISIHWNGGESKLMFRKEVEDGLLPMASVGLG
jgi:hypothetical protein